MRYFALALSVAGFLLARPAVPLAQLADITIVAPSPAGSGWDHVAQALKGALAERPAALDVGIVNVPGASGMVGLSRFLSGQVDGDLLVTGLTMLEASLVSRSFGKMAQLTPVARLAQEPYGIVVPAGSPFMTILDLRASLLADPARIAWAGGPVGGVDHVAAILLIQALGLDPSRLNYVPFLASSDALAAATEGKVGAALVSVGEMSAALANREVRLLAVSSPGRSAGLDAPSFQETGIPFTFANWRGVVARPDLGRDQQARMAAIIERSVGTRSWELLLEGKRWQPAFLPAAEFGEFIQQEHARLKGALLSAGILKRQND